MAAFVGAASANFVNSPGQAGPAPKPGSDAAVMKQIAALQEQLRDLGKQYGELLKQGDDSPAGRAALVALKKMMDSINSAIEALQQSILQKHAREQMDRNNQAQQVQQALAALQESQKKARAKSDTVGTVIDVEA